MNKRHHSVRSWLYGIVVVTLGGQLQGCGGCTADAPPGIDITLTHTSLSTINPSCSAQAIVVDLNDGDTEYLQGFVSNNDKTACRFSGLAHAGSYGVAILLEGYEPVTFSNLNIDKDSCHLVTHKQTVELTPATSNCHDGYEWVNDQCRTPNGCTFPKLEQAVLSGIQGGGTSYSCLDECEHAATQSPVPPSSPGVCDSLALPSPPPN